MGEETLNAFPVLEMIIKTPNEIGVLAKITEKIKEINVNILGIFAVESNNLGEAELLLVTEDNIKVQKVIEELGYKYVESSVILVYLENKIGSLSETAKKLSDAGINIKQLFATASIEKTATAIVSTDNNKKALEILK